MYNIHAAMQMSKQEDIYAYGLITIDRSIRFMIQLRRYQDKDGEEKMLFCYPRSYKNGKWNDVIRLDQDMERELHEAVTNAIKEEIITDLHLPQIEDIKVTVIRCGKEEKTSVCGQASVKVCGLWIDGITIKQGSKGLFCNMPQYRRGDGTYKDLVYAITKKLQQKISEEIIRVYEEMITGGEVK